MQDFESKIPGLIFQGTDASQWQNFQWTEAFNPKHDGYKLTKWK